MHVGVVNYLAGREISTIVILNVDMVRASCYDSSCDVTKCDLIVAIYWKQRRIVAVYDSVELMQPFRFTGALGAGSVFGFQR
jgi:hypothetical protein